jgi:uncharacterized protein (TIGR02145 family)
MRIYLRIPFILLILVISCTKENTDPVIATDYDGNNYKTVKIGAQIWMLENLRTTKFNDGTSIPLATDQGEWAILSSAAYCVYDNIEINFNSYGLLYNWNAVNSGKLAPKGWHIPSQNEWADLFKYLTENGYGFEGFGNDIAKSMATTTGWDSNKEFGAIGNLPENNNKSGFSGLPGGYRDNDGVFRYINNYGSWWSSSQFDTDNADRINLIGWSNMVYIFHSNKKIGCSIKCIMD